MIKHVLGFEIGEEDLYKIKYDENNFIEKINEKDNCITGTILDNYCIYQMNYE